MRHVKKISLITAVTLSIIGSGYAAAETGNRGGAREGRGLDLVSAALIEATDGNVHGLSNLYRIRSGIGMTAHVWGLTPGHPYTVWAVVFNNPRHCAAYPDPCGPDDFGIKRVQARVTQASHNFADGEGHALFSGFVPRGPELKRPTTAEIHFIYRRHPNVDGQEYDALNDVVGSCAEGGDGPDADTQCLDRAFSVHQN